MVSSSYVSKPNQTKTSLLLKLFNKVVLLLWGHLLSTDSLQFGYKVGTTQCSWLVLRQKTCPIMTLLD